MQNIGKTLKAVRANRYANGGAQFRIRHGQVNARTP